ncbi:hypothetical protein BGZ65_006249, partial [Modicella reniformis]
MNNDSDKQPTQAFRDPSTLKVSNIQTVMDPKTGRSIILWRHIQAAFEKAKAIWNGDSLVSFMIDENLEEVIPWRIAYHPGVVLDVVMDTTEQIISTGEAVCLSQIHSAGKEASKDRDDRSNQTVTTPAIADNTTNQSLIIYSKTIPEVSQSSSMLTHNSLHNNSLQTIMSGQFIIKQSIDQHFDRLQIEMDKNKQLQEQVQELQQHTSQELLKKQEEMLQMQQQALDRLANIQSSVQAVLTQTYELHEYPIPRLFIVLPKTVGLREKFKNLLSDQFR